MNCDEVEEHLYPYWDGEVSGPMVRELKNHISDCTNCRGTVDSLRQLDRILYSMEAPEPGAGFAREVMERARDHVEPDRNHRRTTVSSSPGPGRAGLMVTVMVLGLAIGTVLGIDMTRSARATPNPSPEPPSSYTRPEPEIGDASLADIYFNEELYSDLRNPS